MKKTLFVVLAALLSTTAYANNCATYYEHNDFRQAFTACKTEAKHGDREAQFNLAHIYYQRIGVGNKEKAIYWYTKAAEQGLVEAQYYLALMYNMGYVVNSHLVGIDNDKALYWFTKAAEQGFLEAQYKLALMYVDDTGFEVNKEKSLYWLTQAAEQGFDKAENDLGL
ncbi:sel1 repeat family protein, partial [Gilliamella sp. B3773]